MTSLAPNLSDTTIPYTLEQAKGAAVIPAAGRMGGERYWATTVGHLSGQIAITPEERLAKVLRHIETNNAETQRIINANHYGSQRFMRVLKNFALLRSTHLELDWPLTFEAFLGLYPRDPVGQRVLLFEVVTHGELHNWQVAKAFSVSFNEFGERLLEGEQIVLADDALRRMAEIAMRSW